VISFCASLNLTTTAEGIEDTAMAGKLRELGCDFGQGYAFSAPVHASDVASVVESLGSVGSRPGDGDRLEALVPVHS